MNIYGLQVPVVVLLFLSILNWCLERHILSFILFSGYLEFELEGIPTLPIPSEKTPTSTRFWTAAKIEETHSLLLRSPNTLICAALWFCPKLNFLNSQTFGRLTP